MRSTECGMRSTECGIRNAEYGIRNAEYGIRNAECGIISGERGTKYPRKASPTTNKLRHSLPCFHSVRSITRQLPGAFCIAKRSTARNTPFCNKSPIPVAKKRNSRIYVDDALAWLPQCRPKSDAFHKLALRANSIQPQTNTKVANFRSLISPKQSRRPINFASSGDRVLVLVCFTPNHTVFFRLFLCQ